MNPTANNIKQRLNSHCLPNKKQKNSLRMWITRPTGTGASRFSGSCCRTCRRR